MPLNDSSCAPAHNTPFPLERSPPASFKRLLGGTLFVDLAHVKKDGCLLPRRSFGEPLPLAEVGGLRPGDGSLEKVLQRVVLPGIGVGLGCVAVREQRLGESQEGFLVVNSFEGS